MRGLSFGPSLWPVPFAGAWPVIRRLLLRAAQLMVRVYLIGILCYISSLRLVHESVSHRSMALCQGYRIVNRSFCSFFCSVEDMKLHVFAPVYSLPSLICSLYSLPLYLTFQQQLISELCGQERLDVVVGQDAKPVFYNVFLEEFLKFFSDSAFSLFSLFIVSPF